MKFRPEKDSSTLAVQALCSMSCPSRLSYTPMNPQSPVVAQVLHARKRKPDGLSSESFDTTELLLVVRNRVIVVCELSQTDPC